MNHAEFWTSPLLQAAGFRHAFFTRNGGVSRGAYTSLNFSWAVGDRPEHVRENLRRAADALSLPTDAVYFPSQVHGRAALILTGGEDREALLRREGDAVASRNPGLACGVRVADCVPLLLGDRSSGAAAAVHAGWRGIVAGVVEAGVAAVRSLAGEQADIVAAIGPHISVRAFEVSDDVAEDLLSCSPDPDVVDRSLGPRPHVDLRRIVHAQLHALGLDRDAIDDVHGCTVGDAVHLYSYRRDGKQSGRHLAAIVPTRR